MSARSLLRRQRVGAGAPLRVEHVSARLRPPGGRAIAVWFALLFFVGGLVTLLALSDRGVGSSYKDYYTLYADALRDGRLWVATASDPDQCPHDASFYQGKCYLYFGILPAVFRLGLPFLTDHFVALLFGALAVFAVVELQIRLASLIGARQRTGILLAHLSTLVAIAIFPTMVVGRVYEEAVVVAYALGLCGILVLLPVMTNSSREVSFARAFAGSLLLAGAALTRSTWFLAAIVLFGLLAYRQVRLGTSLSRSRLLWAMAVVFGLAGSFQMGLNWIRFGHPLEFGLQYVTTQIPWNAWRPHGDLSFHYLLPNLLLYYGYGLFTFSRYHSSLMSWPLEETFIYEFVTALPLAMPALFAVAGHIWLRQRANRLEPLRPLAGPGLVLGSLGILPLLMCSQSFRYQPEAFAWVVVVAPVLGLATIALRRWSLAFAAGAGIAAVAAARIFQSVLMI